MPELTYEGFVERMAVTSDSDLLFGGTVSDEEYQALVNAGCHVTDRGVIAWGMLFCRCDVMRGRA